jgi:hypothetical protein
MVFSNNLIDNVHHAWHSIIPMLFECAAGAFLIDTIFHLAGYNKKRRVRQIDRQWNRAGIIYKGIS